MTSSMVATSHHLESPGERRRHRRFTMTAPNSGLELAGNRYGEELRSCRLLNLSYSGMCFRTDRLLQPGKPYRFHIRLQWPVEGQAWVSARIRWARPADGQWEWGAEFVKSTNGWFGPRTVNREE
jgi:hypothetical protein